VLDELGLTYPQYIVLVELHEQDDPTVGGLPPFAFEVIGFRSVTVMPAYSQCGSPFVCDGLSEARRRRRVRGGRAGAVPLAKQGR
jgi:hypothetical protein